MLRFVVLLLAAGLLEARPQAKFFPSFIEANMIVGGENANQGEFPWQLSQQRQGAAGAWSHSCGASLLGATRALSAAHCLDGANANIIRVIAGLHDRTVTTGTQTSNAARYVNHNGYNNGQATFANDIAIIHLLTSISTVSGRIAYATLPANNNNNYAGQTCIISGWGRTSSSNTLPNVLQKASIQVLTTADCRTRMSNVGGANIWDNHICVYDTAQQKGSCNGDSGGPLNCGNIVAGVTSFGVSSILGNCQQSYPSVYTRTSTYLAWIGSN